MTSDLAVLLACTRDVVDRQVHSLTAIQIALTAATRDDGQLPDDLVRLLESISTEVSSARRSAVALDRHLRDSLHVRDSSDHPRTTDACPA